MTTFHRWARIILYLPALFAIAMPVHAQTARLRIDPLSLVIKPGAQSSLSIVFDHVDQLYGLEVHLSFDPAVIQVLDANVSTEGVQVSPASWLKDAFIAVNTVDNSQGVIDFAAMLPHPAQPVSGQKTVLSLHVQGAAEGSTRLSITDAILVNQGGMMIPVEIQSGSVSVSPGGKIPSIGLGGQPAGFWATVMQQGGAISAPALLILGAVVLVILALVSSLALYAAQGRRRGF